MELLRVFQEIHHFLDLFFGLITASHIGKRHLVVVFIQHPGLALAKAEGPAFTSALHLTHEINPHTDQQQHGPPTDQQGHEQGTFFSWLHVEFNVVVDEVAHQASVEVGGIGANAPIICSDCNDLGSALSFLDGGGFDSFGMNLV